ncbi:MAG: DUF2067 family protein [Desulfurococcaceae archaeon]
MPLIKRRFYVPCKEDECLKLYELLKDRMPSINYISMQLTGRGLLLEAHGYESDIKDLWIEVKRLVGPLKEITRKAALRKYPISLVAKMIRKTFPPKLLMEILRRMNYTAEHLSDEDSIVTNAPLEVILRLAERIADLNPEATRLAANTSTRYYIIAGCILSEMSLEGVVGLSADLNILKRSEDGRHVLVVDWRTALDIFLKNIKK